MIANLSMAGFAPDISPLIQPSDQGTSGHWLSCDGWYPTLRGFRRTPSAVATYPALPTRVSPADVGACYGAFVAKYLDGTTKLIAGTKTKLYYGSIAGTGIGSWTDYSTLEDFSTDDGDRWRFAQFGNDTLAVNGSDVPQFLASTGSDFAALAGVPPIAKIIATVNNFVFLLNLFSPDVGSLLTPTMWWCSGIGDDASWTPDLSTMCVNGYLDDTEGEIVGAKPLGRNLIVYKQRATYIFQFVGPPVVWENQVVSREAGALSHEAIVDIGDAHVVMGLDDFYMMDGANPPQPIPNPLRRFVFQDSLDRNLQSAVIGRWDRTTQVVYWHYPSVDIGSTGWPQICDKWVAWHRQSGKWTMGDLEIEATVYPDIPGSTGLTYGDFGSLYTTWGAPVTDAYDSYLIAGSTDVVQGIFDPTHVLSTLTGEPAAGATIELGDFGNDENFLFVRRLRPHFGIYPSIAGTSITDYKRLVLGGTAVTGTTAYLDRDPGWLNLRDNARLHRFTLTAAAGDCEIIGLDIDFDEAGIR